MTTFVYSMIGFAVGAVISSFYWLARTESFRNKVESQVKDSKELTGEIEKLLQHKRKEGDQCKKN